ncbi:MULTISPECIES: hypothetical protein [unclassified Pseudanabaena]|uniref:hypothetical protein n=1 Tax=unclassified Pseudanabaena TaxID=2593292 RepID=UPI000B996F69|nr:MULTISPECIES: hypothetical protein [unclassified Pseudanabaena]OYQ66123.1 hypothetical protein B9G53_05260 [Pseudanabaena sp. SR411]BBC26424.1 hypothetical protein ABRG53_4167 [Pseudanabaena sp. ABRG5-3]
MSVKELLINKLDLMSENELEKVLKLLQVFGLADRTSSQSKSYPLRGLPIEYIDPMEPVAVADWDVLG